MENYKFKDKFSKRFCPECFTQEIIAILYTNLVFQCTWCCKNFTIQDLATIREKREKIIDNIFQ